MKDDMQSTEPLISIVYTSSAREPFSPLALRALLDQSRAANDTRGVTGMLLYRTGRFFQVLEGPEAEVRSLVSVIAHDPRHIDMRVIMEEPIGRRQFADWSMGYESIQAPTENAPAGFRDTFDDLNAEDDASAVTRAVRELTLWFRVRASTETNPAPWS
jgi:hypothetical protein